LAALLLAHGDSPARSSRLAGRKSGSRRASPRFSNTPWGFVSAVVPAPEEGSSAARTIHGIAAGLGRARRERKIGRLTKEVGWLAKKSKEPGL
ncbi:MAG: hypothetical protein KGR69_09970, partial [Verrucomicrobia bacterium]|nr:hypothetical protein [Verrucomicrobiota bacterium]